MARPAKPLALHKAEGTYRGDRHGDQPVLPMLVKVSPPKWFDKQRRQELKRIVDFWATGRNILTEADIPQLIALADYTAQYNELAADVVKNGSLEEVITEEGRKTLIRKSVKLRDEAFSKIAEIGARFGMTPSDRAKMFNTMRQAGQKAEKPKHELDEKDW